MLDPLSILTVCIVAILMLVVSYCVLVQP